MKIVLLIFLMCLSYWVFPQSRHPAYNTKTAEPFMEQYLADAETTSPDFELLMHYYLSPLDLNKADKTDLQVLGVLNNEEIDALIAHKARFGKLLSIYELQAVKGWSQHTLDRILPFVKISDAGNDTDSRPLLERIRKEENHYLLLRWQRALQKQQGFIDNKEGKSAYLGSPDKLFLKWRLSRPRDFSFGITAEKDAGESFRYGADYISAHVGLFNKGVLKSLIIGDYQMQIGQGLLYGGGFTTGKGSETILSAKRNHIGILPYSSSMESGFLRGCGFTLTKGAFDFTGFGSLRNLDANTEAENITIKEDGFHRTETEVKNRKQLTELLTGGHLRYQPSFFPLQVGLTYSQTRFSHHLSPTPTYYNQFYFQGKRLALVGFDLDITWQNLTIFSEVGKDLNAGLGYLAGVMAGLSKYADLTLLYRDYARDFHTFYGNTFGESSQNINESGLYVGLKVYPNRQWEISAYIDQFKFPWLRFQVNRPSVGYDSFLRVKWKPSKAIAMYGQYKCEVKEKNTEILANTEVSQLTKQQWRFDVDYGVSKELNLGVRYQASQQLQDGAESTSGMVLLQDVSYQYKSLRFSARWAVFDTDDYDNRQYVYEKNVLYAFSFPAYYGQGMRQVYIVQYKPSTRMSIWGRYAVSHYSNQEVIGSGNDLIEGTKKSEVTLQLLLKF
ncbi:hypothetical protein V6R21_12730 [Limibacter armeniacum]|uniref:ComEA family DNA-binding protein n=1 Tax=Limibacter armeniacum TaxID=466084 RepID=UPI002FE65DD5